jgi:hypothetical protein
MLAAHTQRAQPSANEKRTETSPTCALVSMSVRLRHRCGRQPIVEPLQGAARRVALQTGSGSHALSVSTHRVATQRVFRGVSAPRGARREDPLPDAFNVNALPRSAGRGSGACRAVAEDGGQTECAARLVGSSPQPAVDGGIGLVLPGVLV